METHHKRHGGGARGWGGVAYVASDPRLRDDRDVTQDLANSSRRKIAAAWVLRSTFSTL